MDYTRDAQQIKRVQDKLAHMARREGNLVRPEEPVLLGGLEDLEEAEGVRLPEDYREIIRHSADGGQVPDGGGASGTGGPARTSATGR